MSGRKKRQPFAASYDKLYIICNHIIKDFFNAFMVYPTYENVIVPILEPLILKEMFEVNQIIFIKRFYIINK